MIKKSIFLMILATSIFTHAQPTGQLLNELSLKYSEASDCASLLQELKPSWLMISLDHQFRNLNFTDFEKEVIAELHHFLNDNSSYQLTLMGIHPLDHKFFYNLGTQLLEEKSNPKNPFARYLRARLSFRVVDHEVTTVLWHNLWDYQRYRLFFETESHVPLKIELNNLRYNILKLVATLKKKSDQVSSIQELSLLASKIEKVLLYESNFDKSFLDYLSFKEIFLEIAQNLLRARFQKENRAPFGLAETTLLFPPSKWGSHATIKFPIGTGELTKKWFLDHQSIVENPMFPPNDPLRMAATLFLFSSLTELPVEFSPLPKTHELNYLVTPESWGSYYSDPWNVKKFHSSRHIAIVTSNRFEWPENVREENAFNLGYVSWQALLDTEAQFAE